MTPPGPALTVVEVSPRDGLQSLQRHVETADKLTMIERLLDAGLAHVEVTSFAHPRMVPRLADAAEVMRRLPRRPGVSLRGLVPNRRGAERAIAAGVDVVVAFVSASAAYSEKNQNMTTAQALAQLEDIGRLAHAAGVGFGVGISMALGSPYEGEVPPDHVLAIAERCVALEPTDLYVADTIGAATPAQVADLCARTRARWPRLRLSVHLHGAADARALACAVAAVRAGAVQIEASVCGLGGPVVRSPGSALVGNLATEALVATCDRLGIETGLDPGAVAAAARDVAALLGLPPGPAGPPAAEVQRLAGAA